MGKNCSTKLRTYHFGLDKRFEGVDLLIALPLHKLDFTESTLADNLQCAVILRTLGSSEETKEVGFLLLGSVLLLLLTGVRQLVAQTNALKLLRSVESQYTMHKNCCSSQQYNVRTSRCESWPFRRSP